MSTEHRVMRMEWSTEAGIIILQYPSNLSKGDAEDLGELFSIAMTGIVRRAKAASPSQPNASEEK